MEKCGLGYSNMPKISAGNILNFRKMPWARIDLQVKKELGIAGLAVPSVRVGISWVLEYLGFSRSKNQILVPQFLSKCIHDCLNRYALPVEEATSRTTAVLLVEQFGFSQDKTALDNEIAARNLVCIEDNASCISTGEVMGPKSFARFICFSKLLPVLKGGFLISADSGLQDFINKKRSQKNTLLVPEFIYHVLSHFRKNVYTPENYSVMELAYAAYFHSPSDNNALRTNFLFGIKKAGQYHKINQQRIDAVKNTLGDKVLYPEADFLRQVLLLPAGDKEAVLKWILRENCFEDNVYHFDINRNIFKQKFEIFFLIPLNSDIPWGRFLNLIKDIGEVL